ncbi:FKBP-type peptidyl-prolyl cis-trans isomerase [Mucilaginibacter segetis]|uniref:Peptidyl-prolyl cis-trans isomerase n=1 Tax=Mucilaginibacter segetis TaxID=2793071 RepID=A0A934UP11_9SPHI|nr:FKBP-type peptidyl-prolyl cis-trans isomerase [Mucilaginibacter segetis]MBK0380497.1 FKBP-type peptidyl-prolyl cis-trans isomerase [Mucilaginibacter segetis]
MNRLLLILWCVVGLCSCKKGYDEVANYRAQAAKDDQIIADYIAATPGLADEAKRIDTTGVYYVVIAPGSGNDLFTNSTRVTVDYTGKILGADTVFTQSNNFHPTFALSEVIKGWQLGIPKIKKGGTVRLLIPSRYAYGPFDQPSIGLPANSVVDFNIQLLDVTN